MNTSRTRSGQDARNGHRERSRQAAQHFAQACSFHTKEESRAMLDRRKMAFVALAVAVVSCGDGAPLEAGEQGFVEGRVTDAAGRPIAGAEVVVNNTVWQNHNLVLSS